MVLWNGKLCELEDIPPVGHKINYQRWCCLFILVYKVDDFLIKRNTTWSWSVDQDVCGDSGSGVSAFVSLWSMCQDNVVMKGCTIRSWRFLRWRAADNKIHRVLGTKIFGRTLLTYMVFVSITEAGKTDSLVCEGSNSAIHVFISKGVAFCQNMGLYQVLLW